jgi:hypothetical protein
MKTITFDTYKVVNMLQTKGFTKDQAEALVEAAKEIDLSEIATKGDLKDLKNELHGEIRELQINLMKWITGMLLAQAGLIVALLQIFN